MTTRDGSRRSFVEWAWQSDKLRELRQQSSVSQRSRIADARSCLTIAWRALCGLEDIPDDSRLAVALPLLAQCARLCTPIIAPDHGGIAHLFDEPAWKERFQLGGLSEERQRSVQGWLRGEPATDDAKAVAEDTISALRTVLDAVDVDSGAIASVLVRRVALVLSSAAVLLALGTAAVAWLGSAHAVDLAVGKPWVASSAYTGYSTEGIKASKPVLGLFFSTIEQDKPWWRLDLGRPQSIASVDVVNRSDCCPERAHPLVLELSTDGNKWREVARRDEPFRTWTASFPSTKARFLRLRSTRRTLLHLKDVRVYSSAP